MRRFAKLLAGAAAVVVVLAGTAGAQDALPAGWASSTATVSGTTLSGAMQRDGTYWDWQSLRNRPYQVGVSVAIARPAEVPADCAVPVADEPGTSTTRREFSHTLAFECNGTYPVTITGTANADGGTATLLRSIVVAMPPPAVTGVAVALDGDAVDLRWDDMTAQAKDLTGYQVERRVDGGSWTEIASVERAPDGSLPTAARDDELPSSGDVLTYRVTARRAGTTETAGSDASQASITRAGDPVPDPGGDGSGTGGDSGTGSGVTPGEPSPGEPSAGAGPGAGSGSGRRAETTRVVAPRLGITGSFLPPLLRPSVPAVASSPGTPADEGFDESLPYDPDGPAEAEAPDDELAAFFGGETAGRGMLVPVATALVLAVWAFHLRVLARAARPD